MNIELLMKEYVRVAPSKHGFFGEHKAEETLSCSGPAKGL